VALRGRHARDAVITLSARSARPTFSMLQAFHGIQSFMDLRQCRPWWAACLLLVPVAAAAQELAPPEPIHLLPIQQVGLAAEVVTPMQQELITGLSAGGIAVQPPDDVVKAAPDLAGGCAEPGCLAEIARLTPARYLLLVKVEQVGPDAWLSAEMFDAASGAVVTRDREAVNITEGQPWNAAAQRLSQRLGPPVGAYLSSPAASSAAAQHSKRARPKAEPTVRNQLQTVARIEASLAAVAGAAALGSACLCLGGWIIVLLDASRTVVLSEIGFSQRLGEDALLEAAFAVWSASCAVCLTGFGSCLLMPAAPIWYFLRRGLETGPSGTAGTPRTVMAPRPEVEEEDGAPLTQLVASQIGQRY